MTEGKSGWWYSWLGSNTFLVVAAWCLLALLMPFILVLGFYDYWSAEPPWREWR